MYISGSLSSKKKNLQHSTCNYKYLKTVSVSKYSKGTYVLNPQERLENVQSIFLIQVFQVSETYTSELPRSFHMANNEFSLVASLLG